VGPVRIVAGWDDPGTSTAVREVLRAALRGEACHRGPVALVVGGPRAGATLRLRDGVLGRAPDAEVRLDDPSVSRRHARLRLAGERILVEDLGSRNGSWKGRRRIRAPVELAPGDELRAGRTVLALGLAPDGPAPARRPAGRARRPGRLLAATALLLAVVAALAGAWLPAP
jgi:predicted component of type VI protein secretion system